MFNQYGKYGIYAYFILLLTVLLVPKDIMNIPYQAYVIFVTIYVGLWFSITRYLKRHNISDFKYQDFDYLLSDLVLVLGLPILFMSLLIKLGHPLFSATWLLVLYLFLLMFVSMVKIFTYRSRHAGIVRFNVTVIYPLMNLILINQMYVVWYLVHNPGNGTHF